MAGPIHWSNEPMPGTTDRASIELTPLDRERLDQAANGIRLRGNSVKILLKWKTTRHRRGPGSRKAA